ALDFRTAVRLALPSRDDMPLGLALSGVPLDPLNQGKQVVNIDAVDDIRRNGHCVTVHDKSPLFAQALKRRGIRNWFLSTSDPSGLEHRKSSARISSNRCTSLCCTEWM